VFARLLTFPNVIITAHQAFFTRTALENIADTTLSNVRAFELGEPTPNEVHADAVVA
jgi:D-lactate dehydrogenase